MGVLSILCDHVHQYDADDQFAINAVGIKSSPTEQTVAIDAVRTPPQYLSKSRKLSLSLSETGQALPQT
jgi:hypothetical protein